MSRSPQRESGRAQRAGSRAAQRAAIHELRLASAITKRDDVGYYLDRVLKGLHRAHISCCGTCLHARRIKQDMLIDGAQRSTLEELTDWTLWADKMLVF